MKAVKAHSNSSVSKSIRGLSLCFFSQGQIESAEGLILSNLITSPFNNELSLVGKSETASQELVGKIADEILAELDKQLGV